jgi:hypothetical protein
LYKIISEKLIGKSIGKAVMFSFFGNISVFVWKDWEKARNVNG